MTDERAMAEREILDEFIGQLRAPTKDSINDRVTNGRAILSIPIDDKSDEDIKKLFEIESMLRELGIQFDTGMGRGARDWFFDENSLKGAWLQIIEVGGKNVWKET